MLVLFHDITSPASALAVWRLARLARDGLAVRFEGFDAIGVDAALPVDLDVLAMIERLTEDAAREGLTLRRPSVLPPTGLAHVLLHAAEQTEHAEDVRRGIYEAFWTHDADIADAGVLTSVAAEAGMDGPTVSTLLSDRVALAQRRRQMAIARKDGVGGVPVLLASRTLSPALISEPDLWALAAIA